MFIIPFVMHRLPAYSDEPEKFFPERFTPARNAARAKFVYLPFGAGPRQCIGSQFAMVEAQLVLGTLAGRYRLRRAPGHPCGTLAADHAATAVRHPDDHRASHRLRSDESCLVDGRRRLTINAELAEPAEFSGPGSSARSVSNVVAPILRGFRAGIDATHTATRWQACTAGRGGRTVSEAEPRSGSSEAHAKI